MSFKSNSKYRTAVKVDQFFDLVGKGEAIPHDIALIVAHKIIKMETAYEHVKLNLAVAHSKLKKAQEEKP